MTRTISPKQHYDLIIIGGGIYGSVLLWEAINRGYNAVLVESGDFCSVLTTNDFLSLFLLRHCTIWFLHSDPK